MNLRDLNYIFIPWSGFLGALGGWTTKAIRRYLLPLTGAILAYFYGIKWYRCMAYALGTAAAFSLGYSPDRHNIAQIIAVGASYGATPLLLRFKWWYLTWPLMAGLTLAGLMELSLIFNGFSWKFVEILVFSLHGWFVAYAIKQE